MKKMILWITLLLGISVTCMAEKEIQIGITQIIEHPSLDAARKGLEKALQKNLGKKVKIEYQSAQGDFGTAQLIAKSYVNSKKDVIVAISTPSAQAALNATKQIPIVYTAVTDPKIAGLSGKNITGTTDMSPLEEQLNLLKNLLPKAKKVGFLYNPSEQNSVSLLKQFTILAKERQLQVIEKGVNTVNDMNLALNSLLGQVDVLYIPTDNLVTSSESLLIQQANRKNVPVIASVESSVKKGALATVSIDYEKLGYQTGERILEILKGKSPNQIQVEGLRETTLVINERIAKKYGISVKQEVFKGAVLYE
ncbi:ABC transporter substrate-binding protein [Fusobacterium necrophorum subsp. funduliforme]|uniref:Oligopeptide ABC transporter, oligopeptide-binding protein n=4 Tax=Fusobacterium necrophorum TaxID=859 RepID=A0AAN3VUI2_9FUSO|nr:ABC transporter substrate-binding protein [Fusobacterium necrophorum]AVQ20262.1 ABC transporter substrate-binding protein [Fusobacterium necrophorum subsp. funduliforme]AYV93858.1 ABC transporter substrate-binding protein [Fusobacterium necrophorum subsp. funduliforme]AYV96026.1 ABC transporter substrate-binding protein [Fusobacterium necrophorum subsp. funduliforme]EFS24283.1 ABC transporter substrate binding protein [Fusobacterium necrophorum D12]EIJ70564.1 ABC transporter substrate bindi